jgi:hypothetical protein
LALCADVSDKECLSSIVRQNMKRFQLAAIVGSIVTFCSGCQTAADRAVTERARHYEELRVLSVSTVIDASDGISEVEAFRIGQDRFATHGSACGMASLPELVGGSWHITIFIGYAGVPVEHIAIRKNNGAITITDLRPKEMPNQSLEPATTTVAPRADAQVAPVVVAHR